ncbi:MAG: PQQ-dependent sugar dehydrogenase [Acidiferrobacterales bacterium]
MRTTLMLSILLALVVGPIAQAAPKVPSSVADVAQVGGKLPGNPKIQLVKIADGLNDPINVSNAGDGSGRLFVTERVGRIRIVTKTGEVLSEPFIDLTKINPIGGDVQSQFIEQGLYDVAFHPDYKNNGHFFVHYASLPFNGDGFIVRFSVSQDNPNKADPKSSKVILVIPQPWYNHNGGGIKFGPDGYLYIGSGDGGWEGDPYEAGQDLGTLLGKMLRIDVNTPDNVPYAIPRDNPFADNILAKPRLMELFGITEPEFARLHSRVRPEIWAYGLRNPYEFAFDQKTGDLYIADVGQNHWEEVDFQPASSKGGENYGWDLNTGSRCHPLHEDKFAQAGKDCNQVGVPPVAEYKHDFGCSAMGLGVANYAGMNGVYLVGDWCSGRVWGIGWDGRKWQIQELLHTGLQFTSGGYDEEGNVYAVSCQCFYTTDKGPLGNPPGALWKVVAADKVPSGAKVAPLAKK